jgi:type IV conjugative transfer system coupling protein TraD
MDNFMSPSSKLDLAKTFTKGGQVSLHNFRMIRQVLWITMLITLIGGALFMFGKTWIDYSPYERYVIGSSYWADLKLAFTGDKDHTYQVYKSENGQSHSVRSLDIKHNKIIQLWRANFEATVIKNVELSLWMMGGFFCVICGFWIWRGHAKGEKEIIFGTEIVTDKDLKKLIHARKQASDLTLAGVPLIKDKEKQHTLIIGTTGSGKTNCIHEFLLQIRAKSQRAIIIDMTGGFIEKYYRPGIDKILNPLDARSEPWNIWGDCPKSYHLRMIAATVIPPERNGTESYWVKSSRAVFMATAEKLHEQGKLTNENFFDYATNLPIREAESFYKDTNAAAIMNSDASETVMGIRSNLRAHTECLEFFPETDSPFSIREWIHNEESETVGEWLFLSSPPSLREEISGLMVLWTTIATDALMSLAQNHDRRLWIVIDELPAIKKLPKLQTMLAEIRKYGGCVILGTQDMSQLDEIYGHNIVKSIANLCSTKVIFRIEGADIAERLSKWLGVQEVSETIENISYGAHQMRDGVSLNDHRKEKPTIHADRLMKLPDLTGYLKLPGDYPVAKVTFQVHKLEKVAEGFVEAI